MSVLSPVRCGSFHLPCLLFAWVNSDLVAQHWQIVHVTVCETERQKEREGICFKGSVVMTTWNDETLGLWEEYELLL